ncbi:Ku protein [Conexibacter woesei]|uniref:non-homologous end joining protein Ku n=1 Tax=Conexibacter woesei TaxID=191495 RepID=UPI000428004A|nr:Ku protein [Conexibacter woesei]
MARSLWSGSLSFGLVNVPVALYSAGRDLDVHFHQLHEKDGARVEIRRFCSREDEEVAYEDIGKAYELRSGRQVVLTDDELAAIAPQRTRTIEIQSFVDAADVDPILFDHPYWLLPTGESAGTKRAYRLLIEAMGSTDRVALGRFVLRTKEYLVTVRVRDNLLALTTMLFPDEIRPTKDIDNGGRRPAAKALSQAVRLVEALSVDFDPKAYRDEHRRRLQRIVRAKERDGTIDAPAQDDEPSPAPDLMEALRKTMAELGRK